MGEMIQKPDTNPIVIAACNWFFFGALGYFLMGQKKKAIISAVIFVIVSTVSCGTLFWIWMAIASYDAYLVAQKLARGEAVGENENGLGFLNAIFKD